MKEEFLSLSLLETASTNQNFASTNQHLSSLGNSLSSLTWQLHVALKIYECVHPWLIILSLYFTATPAPYSPNDILQHQFYGAQTYFIRARSWRCPLLSANSCVSRLSNSCRRVSKGLQVLQRKACAVCRDSSLCSSLPTWNMCVFQESVCSTAWLCLQIIFKVP